MKIAWRKIGRVVKRVVETVFLLEKSGVINVIPDGKQGKIEKGVEIVEDAIEEAAKPSPVKPYVQR
jgi:predicted transcriptional regulator